MRRRGMEGRGGDIRERALSGAVERGKKRAAPKREWRQGRAQE